MDYGLPSLTSQKEVDVLSQMATHEKRALLHQQESADIRDENNVESSADRALELTAAKADLDATVALLAALPAGELKEEQETKRMRLELRIRNLTRAGSKVDAVAAVQSQFLRKVNDSKAAVLDDFIACLAQRRTELPA